MKLFLEIRFRITTTDWVWAGSTPLSAVMVVLSEVVEVFLEVYGCEHRTIEVHKVRTMLIRLHTSFFA